MIKNATLPKAYTQLLTKAGSYARQSMTGALMLTDLVSLVLAFSLASLVRTGLLGKFPLGRFYSLWPVLVLFILAFFLRGLYPAVGLSPVDELRITTGTVTLVFLVLLAGTFWIKTTETYSRFILTFAWLFSLVLVQVDRWVLRVLGGSFWGEPIVVIGAGPNTDHIVRYLKNNSHLGMRPVMTLKGSAPPNRAEREALKANSIHTAVLVSREVSEETMGSVVNDGQFHFQRVILISSLGWVGSLGVVTHDLEGILGMEIRQNLLNFWQSSLKRSLDILLGSLLLALAAPLLLMAAIAIRLDGKGGILFRQCRVGRNGLEFKMLKFRTMVPDAEQKLQECLEADPHMREEWSATQKMAKDPRLTPRGQVPAQMEHRRAAAIDQCDPGRDEPGGAAPVLLRPGRFLWQDPHAVSPGATGHDRDVAGLGAEQDHLRRAGAAG